MSTILTRIIIARTYMDCRLELVRLRDGGHVLHLHTIRKGWDFVSRRLAKSTGDEP